jgi:hypothetical protein
VATIAAEDAASATSFPRGRRELRRARGELRVLRQYRLMQPLEVRTGVQPELLRQLAPAGLERRKRLRLSARPVEREHQLPEKPIAERVRAHEGLELGHELGSATQGKVRFQALLVSLQPSLLELVDRVQRERLVLEVGQRRAAPQRERTLQQLGSLGGPAARERLAAIPQPLLEPVEVELALLDAQHVAGRPPVEPTLAHDLAQSRDVVLERVPRGRRRPLSPNPLDQAIASDSLVRPQQQHREQRPLLGPTEGLLATVATHHHRAENAELHVPC